MATKIRHSNDSTVVSSEAERQTEVHHENLNERLKKDRVYSHHDPNWDGQGVDFSSVNGKAVLRKMDLHLLPMLALLYLLSFLDRGNIGNAKIEGLTETLNISGPQYNWCLTVFFFTYCLFEVPSNLM